MDDHENNNGSLRKITIDMRMLHASGIGTYLRNVVPLIIAACPATTFYLLGNTQEIGQYAWSQGKNIILIDCQVPIYSIAEQFVLVQKIPQASQLFWSPHYNIPVFYHGKLVVTVHDVFHLAMPQYVSGIKKKLYSKGMFAAVGYKANAVMVVSNFTKTELVKLTNIKGETVQVIYNGVANEWFTIEQKQALHPRPYLLYVGNVKPHKNVKAFLTAFALIMDTIPHDIIIVGKREGFITGDTEVAEQARLLGGRVHFTGYVSDEVLRQYVAQAAIMVFPSLYEGFGLPPLEGMACGCPVIASTAASLPEVCGDAVLYCNPQDPQHIADQIKKLTEDITLQETLRQKGLTHAQQFTWQKCAQETIAVIKEVLTQ